MKIFEFIDKRPITSIVLFLMFIQLTLSLALILKNKELVPIIQFSLAKECKK
jgi:hypothetical protein